LDRVRREQAIESTEDLLALEDDNE
jgi:hypothetical protein